MKLFCSSFSPTKKTFLTKEERKDLLEKIYEDEPRVRIDSWDGLIVDYVKEHDILIGKLTPCEEDPSPEAKLLRALYINLIRKGK